MPPVLVDDIPEHIGDEYAPSAEREPPVANARVSHDVPSQLGHLARVSLAGLVERLLDVDEQGFAGQAEGIGDRVLGDRAAPLVDDRPPGQAARDLIEDIGDADPGPPERESILADLRIDDHVTTEYLDHTSVLPRTRFDCPANLAASPLPR